MHFALSSCGAGLLLLPERPRCLPRPLPCLRPYHISALYVVDLVTFRRLRAGDRLRAAGVADGTRLAGVCGVRGAGCSPPWVFTGLVANQDCVFRRHVTFAIEV